MLDDSLFISQARLVRGTQYVLHLSFHKLYMEMPAFSLPSTSTDCRLKIFTTYTVGRTDQSITSSGMPPKASCCAISTYLVSTARLSGRSEASVASEHGEGALDLAEHNSARLMPHISPTSCQKQVQGVAYSSLLSKTNDDTVLVKRKEPIRGWALVDIKIASIQNPWSIKSIMCRFSFSQQCLRPLSCILSQLTASVRYAEACAYTLRVRVNMAPAMREPPCCWSAIHYKTIVRCQSQRSRFVRSTKKKNLHNEGKPI